MSKQKFRKGSGVVLASLLLLACSPAAVYADEVTDFENWTPDGNGGYTNSSGQTGANGSSDVNVNDEGSGKSESSSNSTESGKVTNTETNKESSVTITTTESSGSSQDITNVGNGQLIPTIDKENGSSQSTESTRPGSSNSGSDSDSINNDDNNEYIENPKPNKPNNPSKPHNSNGGEDTNSGNQTDSWDHTNNKPNSPIIPWKPEEESVWDKYGNHWGMSTAETIESVTVTEDGKWLVNYRFEDGTQSSISFDTIEDFTFVLTGVKNEKGEKMEKEFRFQRSDELTEWIFKYYLWRAVNLSFKTSSYYGAGKNVAKTIQSNAVFTLDEAGKYRVLATPYHDVRHYHIYEWEDEDGSHSEEITDYWEYDRTKSPDIYSVIVPIITGDPVKVCVNGGCDCGTNLNAVCDEDNEPVYDIENRVELEK